MNRPLSLLLESAMLWATNRSNPYVVVEAAVQALIEDVDSPALRQLAGATRESAVHEVPDVWPAVVSELDLPELDPDSDEAQSLAARAYVRTLVNDGVRHRELTRLFHKEFHHGAEGPLEKLRRLDDEYDHADSATERTTDVLDAETDRVVREFLHFD